MRAAGESIFAPTRKTVLSVFVQSERESLCHEAGQQTPLGIFHLCFSLRVWFKTPVSARLFEMSILRYGSPTSQSQSLPSHGDSGDLFARVPVPSYPEKHDVTPKWTLTNHDRPHPISDSLECLNTGFCHSLPEQLMKKGPGRCQGWSTESQQRQSALKWFSTSLSWEDVCVIAHGCACVFLCLHMCVLIFLCLCLYVCL